MHMLFFSFQHDYLHTWVGFGFLNWVGAGGWGGSFYHGGALSGGHMGVVIRMLFKTYLFIYLLCEHVMFIFMFVSS